MLTEQWLMGFGFFISRSLEVAADWENSEELIEYFSPLQDRIAHREIQLFASGLFSSHVSFWNYPSMAPRLTSEWTPLDELRLHIGLSEARSRPRRLRADRGHPSGVTILAWLCSGLMCTLTCQPLHIYKTLLLLVKQSAWNLHSGLAAAALHLPRAVSVTLLTQNSTLAIWVKVSRLTATATLKQHNIMKNLPESLVAPSPIASGWITHAVWWCRTVVTRGFWSECEFD